MADEPQKENAGTKTRLAVPSEGGAGAAAELIARLRHEINNPLTGLIGQAQLLLRDQNLSEDARRRVETMEQLAKRIRDTVAALRVEQTTGGVPDDAGPADEPPRH